MTLTANNRKISPKTTLYIPEGMATHVTLVMNGEDISLSIERWYKLGQVYIEYLKSAKK